VSDSIDDFAEPTAEGGFSGTSVRQLKTSPAAVWYGDCFGTEVRGIQTPGGNEGPLIRMYHPRLGLWIVQQIWEEPLSYRSSGGQFRGEGREEGDAAHDQMVDNLIVG
jgi:hypothetical protein